MLINIVLVASLLKDIKEIILTSTNWIRLSLNKVIHWSIGFIVTDRIILRHLLLLSSARVDLWSPIWLAFVATWDHNQARIVVVGVDGALIGSLL